MPFSHRLCCSDESTMNIPSSWQDKGSVGWPLYPVCVWEGGSQIVINGSETLSSPPILSKLQLSFHLQQQWECRPGIWEHFWKLFSQLLITGNNYKFLVCTFRRLKECFQRPSYFPWPLMADRVLHGRVKKYWNTHMIEVTTWVSLDSSLPWDVSQQSTILNHQFKCRWRNGMSPITWEVNSKR